METFLHRKDKDELIQSFIEIEIKDSDDFLKIKETLTRMGIANTTKKTLYQSCHILHKRGKYYVVHFKELFALDGREVEFYEDDEQRRNAIALILEKWNLCKIINNKPKDFFTPKNFLGIISFAEKKDWSLEPKYRIGKK